MNVWLWKIYERNKISMLIIYFCGLLFGFYILTKLSKYIDILAYTKHNYNKICSPYTDKIFFGDNKDKEMIQKLINKAIKNKKIIGAHKYYVIAGMGWFEIIKCEVKK